MTIALVKGTEVKRPTTTPLNSSVLDHAEAAGNVRNFGEDEGFGWTNDNGMWNSYNSLETLVPLPLCPDPLFEETGDYKQFGSAEWMPSLTFAVYGGVACSAVALDTEDQKAELERVFGLNEGRGVEQALLGNRFIAQAADPADPLQGSWAAPTDITPTGDISPRVAIGLLEGWAAEHYAGVPTLHMPRALGSILGSEVINWVDGLAFTKMGSKIAFGGGYDEHPQDGTFDIYATGEVYVERSGVLSLKSMTMPNDGTGRGVGSDLDPNTAIALVERMFRVAVDGFVTKATATVPAVTGGGFTA